MYACVCLVGQQDQVKRVKQRFDRITDDLSKYSYISNLRDRNETLFYRVVMDNIDEMGTRDQFLCMAPHTWASFSLNCI